jgi:hypothetical protein
MTNFRNLAFAAVLGALAVSLMGCGSSGYPPVSGVVTLNGNPCRNCIVMFQPMSTPDNPQPGRGSSGQTDQDGRFTLKCDDGRPGAAVGKHQIRIITIYNKEVKGYEVWDPALKKMVKVAGDPIPKEWNSDTKQDFEVPSGGTDKANFAIVTSAKTK